MDSDEAVEVLPRRPEFYRKPDDLHDFARFITDERRAKYFIRRRVDDEAVEAGRKIPFLPARATSESASVSVRTE